MADKPSVTADTLRKLDPVFKLTADQIDDLATQLTIERCAPGTVLFREGERDSSAIFLLKGDISIAAAAGQPQILSANSEQAQKPLAPGRPRPATATCATAAEIIRIDSDLLETMVTWGQLATPEPEVVMSEDGIFTVDKGSWLKKMVKSPTFKNLPPANIEQLLDKLEPIRVRAGTVVIRQGDPGDYFYMIDQGTALVTRQTDAEEGESIEMAELKEGTSFGEAALISDKPRNATVSMTTDGVLLRLSKADFLTLLTEPNVRWISAADAQQRVAAGAQWLDIRLPSEFAAGHLRGAVNIPVQQLHRRARELDAKITYICYCDNGRRSSAASFILKQHGHDAWVLKGGTEQLPAAMLVKGS